jgi:hypothetical protein
MHAAILEVVENVSWRFIISAAATIVNIAHAAANAG